MGEVGGEIRKLSKSESDLKRQILDTSNALGPQEQALKDAAAEYAQIESRVNETAASLNALGVSTDLTTRNAS
ncbi:hypothetical protein OE165_28840, partial [Escherichia coli]|uniref:hypothetical protein n=1 Tax=Escherichia coli TaxID=562 RepID=UPI0021F3C061